MHHILHTTYQVHASFVMYSHACVLYPSELLNSLHCYTNDLSAPSFPIFSLSRTSISLDSMKT